MANPTSNFGWQMPTNTDLVKDLPADFEVFGQAVDTDFADLKGGTTGQVLSKTSGTDLDFTWITPSTSPLTTKGDLYGYSTADARIPVGSNGTVLTADSTESLGVKWATPSAPSIQTLIMTRPQIRAELLSRRVRVENSWFILSVIEWRILRIQMDTFRYTKTDRA